MSLYDRMLESVNRLRPTDQQLAIARQLGLTVKPGMSLEDVSRLISETKANAPPTQEQLARADMLGISVTPEMSIHEVQALIDKSDSSGTFTQHQLAEAMALGVTVNDEMTHAEVAALILQAQAKNPPLEKQIEMCEKLGLPLKAGMNRGQIERLLSYAKKNPRYSEKFDAIDPARRRAQERKQRNQFGDELVDQLKKWKSREDRRQYLVVYEKGPEIFVDVAIVETVDIKQDDEPYIQVQLALPLVVHVDAENEYLEWGKVELLSAGSFRRVTRLKSKLEPDNLSDYRRLIAYGNQQASERNSQTNGLAMESDGLAN